MKNPNARVIGELAWKLWKKASALEKKDPQRGELFQLAEELVLVAYDVEEGQ